MILSKAALQIVNLCAPDKAIPALNCVCVEPDGSMVASNSKVWAWVSPLAQERRKLVPLDDTPIAERLVLSADGIQQVIKAIPRDTQFKGLLEHADISVSRAGTPGVHVIITDGKQRHGIELRRVSHTFPDYRKLFADAWAELQDSYMYERDPAREPICLNRKRMGNVCVMADKVCNYDGAFAPMLWYFAADGSVVMRTVNELNGQRLVCLFSASETEYDELSPEERHLFARGARKAMKIV